MSRFFDGLDTLIGWITATLLALAYLLSVFSVFERYVIAGSGIDWIWEVVVFGMVWAILLSVARIEHRRAHIRMDMVWRRFGERGRIRAEFVSLVLGLAISLFLVYAGYFVVQDAMMWDERTDSSLRLPFWAYYLSLGSCFAVHALFVIHRLIRLARGELVLETGDLTN
ncbi:MAG: TRAP transporter small permease [Burkholderiaceae bacterium]